MHHSRLSLLTVSHSQPWFNEKIKAEIILRRHKEQVFRQNPTEYNYWAFYHQRRHVMQTLLRQLKNSHYINAISGKQG